MLHRDTTSRRQPVDDGQPRTDLRSGVCPCCHADTFVDQPETDRFCRLCGWTRRRPTHTCQIRGGLVTPPLAADRGTLLARYGPCPAQVDLADGGARACGAPRAQWTWTPSPQFPPGIRGEPAHGLACTTHPDHGPDRPPFELAPLAVPR